MANILFSLRTNLQQNADPSQANSQRFFKEKVKSYGVKTGTVAKIAKEYWQKIKQEDKKTVFELCEELLQSDYNEETWIAANWAYWLHQQYRPADFVIFESWINKYINNWAKCDTLCNHAVGAFIEQHPEFIKNLKDWTQSSNLWVRRAAAVSLVIPAKKGKFLADIFEIADKLLLDREDLVQKGYGWLLKEASRLHQPEILAYVLKHKLVMPRTALRYAIEKMPPELKRQAMAR
jgi:3-methyladenine DNA glycosylase AlkD